MADIETDALVAARWPEAWRNSKAKGRNRLRKRFRDENALAELKSAGAKCADCTCFNTKVYSKPTCDLGNDFHGYQPVEPDDLCLRFSKS